jgi:hypothetical protein
MCYICNGRNNFISVVIYRVIQEERSVFGARGDSIGNYEQKVHMNTCIILNGY